MFSSFFFFFSQNIYVFHRSLGIFDYSIISMGIQVVRSNTGEKECLRLANGIRCARIRKCSVLMHTLRR